MLSNKQIFFYKILADFVFIVHFLLVLTVMFGWLFPKLFYFFLAAIIATALSEILFKYCLLSKIEFGLRRKINPDKHYDKSCIVHYWRVFRGMPPRLPKIPSPNFFKRNSFIFILILLFAASILYRVFLQDFILLFF